MKINVVTRLQDNGDGGYTMHIYNNNEEMLADHPALEDLKDEVEEYEQKRQEILTEDDPYENGYLGTDVIEVTEDGKIVPFSLHAGQ